MEKTVKIGILDTGFDSRALEYFSKRPSFYDSPTSQIVETMSDTSGHGTAIALLIGSNSKLKSSIYGLCPTAEYYIAKITDSFGFSNSEYIHRALLFMAEQDVDIINISFGGSEYNEEIRQDCDYLKQQGCFVIAPSGDDGCDEEVLFPADYEAVYSIAAQDKNGDVFQTANSKSMNGTSNILAPGYEIPSRVVYANASSGVSGVNWEPQRKRWRAKITVKRKTIFLGYFKNKEDAIKARIEGERKYWNPLL